MSLRDDILADPACAAAYAARDCVELARIRSIGRARRNDREVGNGTILEVLGLAAGNAFLDVINGDSNFRHVKPLVEQGRLTIGSPLAQATVQSLVPTVLTKEQADAMCALGMSPDPLTALEVAAELFNDDGSPR